MGNHHHKPDTTRCGCGGCTVVRPQPRWCPTEAVVAILPTTARHGGGGDGSGWKSCCRGCVSGGVSGVGWCSCHGGGGAAVVRWLGSGGDVCGSVVSRLRMAAGGVVTSGGGVVVVPAAVGQRRWRW
nr:hypothetical protein [Tanacetum cinerariifolium]